MHTPATADTSTPFFPSRRRRLLAAYIDYLLFGAFWTVVDHFTGLERIPPWIEHGIRVPVSGALQWIAFLVLDVLLHLSLASPGLWMLGVRRQDMAMVPEPARPRLVVDSGIKRRESWITIAIGVAAISEGTKSAVRWTMWNPPAPLFGLATDPASNAVLSITTGMVEIAIACLLLRMRRTGWWLALAGAAVSLASTIASWNLWDGYVAEMITRRRAYQGVPLRPDEIGAMQSVTPEILVASTLILAIALVLTRRRYDR